jgi:hypothetical protein
MPNVRYEDYIDTSRWERRFACLAAHQLNVAGSTRFRELLLQLIQHLGLQIDRIYFPSDAYSKRHGDGKVASSRANIGDAHPRSNR